MLRRLAWCFWFLLGLVFYTYIGYGVVVALLVRLRPPRRELPAPEKADLPPLTMVVAAHNEESCIGAKLENCLQLDYPRDRLSLIFVTDGSTDSTVDLLTAYPLHRHRQPLCCVGGDVDGGTWCSGEGTRQCL